MEESPAIKAYYDKLAQDYEADRFHNSYGQYIQAQELRILHKYLAAPCQGSCLDLACGSGRYLKFASHGFDISPKMIAVAQAKHPEIEFEVGDAIALPYADGSFTDCLSFHLMMHLELESLQKILKEVQRILKPGGQFILDLPSAKRRKLINYQAEGWHGAFSMDIKGMKDILGADWQLQAYHGIALFPIHHIPQKLRPLMRRIDSLLCRIPFLKDYASYLIIVLKKRK